MTDLADYWLYEYKRYVMIIDNKRLPESTEMKINENEIHLIDLEGQTRKQNTRKMAKIGQANPFQFETSIAEKGFKFNSNDLRLDSNKLQVKSNA